MPIYEYRCQACAHDLEVMQKMSDPELLECPACGQPQLQKLISAVGFRLKGSGWYETDFKQSNQKNIAKDESAPKAAPSSESGASSSTSNCANCPAAA